MLAQDFIVRASLDKMPNILILWAFRHYTCAIDLLYSVGKAVVLEIFKKKKKHTQNIDNEQRGRQSELVEEQR